MRWKSLVLLLALATGDPLPACGRGSAVEAAPRPRAVIGLTLDGPRSLTLGAALAARREVQALWADAGVEIRPPSVERADVRLRVGFIHAPESAGAAQPLGALRFEGGNPKPRIDVYYDAVLAVAAWPRARFPGRDWTTSQRDRRIGRVLGRVIAHEIGHYLFASREHTAGGLMKAGHTQAEFVAESRRAFRLSGEELLVVGTRADQ